VIHHRHKNSILSGAYYVEAPPNCGRIVFETPLIAHRMSDFPRYAKETPFSMTQYAVDPSPGRLVLFPSWLGHRTETNEANAERIVIIPTGNDRDSLSVTRGIPKKAKV